MSGQREGRNNSMGIHNQFGAVQEVRSDIHKETVKTGGGGRRERKRERGRERDQNKQKNRGKEKIRYKTLKWLSQDMLT